MDNSLLVHVFQRIPAAHFQLYESFSSPLPFSSCSSWDKDTEYFITGQIPMLDKFRILLFSFKKIFSSWLVYKTSFLNTLYRSETGPPWMFIFRHIPITSPLEKRSALLLNFTILLKSEPQTERTSFLLYVCKTPILLSLGGPRGPKNQFNQLLAQYRRIPITMLVFVDSIAQSKIKIHVAAQPCSW